MKTLQVVSQTDQIPFAGGGSQSAQGKLPEAHHFFDDAEDRFDGRAGSYGQKTSSPRENDLCSESIVVVDDSA